MLTLPAEQDVLAKLVAWGEAQPAVRAMLLSSSRTRPDSVVDLLSDYDVILVVEDAESFAQDAAWIGAYGERLAGWGDESELCGLRTYFRGVVYADYVKIDYSVWPAAVLAHIAALATLPAELDLGYRVLLDKDGGTRGWAAPTYQAYLTTRPSAAEYRAVVEEFWWTATYVAKSLWRDELVFARFCLDHELKLGVLRRMLEWRSATEHGWNVRPGVFGRGLKRRLPNDLWAELAATYVGPEPEANWEALFRTAGLFGRVASEVGKALGYAYPQAVDGRMRAYLEAVRNLPVDARDERRTTKDDC
jgi:aminoglycoside 6-adenylyltransferase